LLFHKNQLTPKKVKKASALSKRW